MLQRLSDAGARLKRAKCVFEVLEIEYLGHLINALGLHPTEEKVRAIKDAPAPKTLQELRSFLGMLNFYGKFIPNLFTFLAPLNVLLRKTTEFTWITPQQKAFNMAKQCLISAPVLVHYDSEKDIVVSCDTSPYGLDAVIAHKFDDGTEKPIAFASRTLTAAETRYSQLDKEALAVIFAIKKFHLYIYGRNFTIMSDHKPLLGLLSLNKCIPDMASPRVQRWSLMLSAYDYNIKYRCGIDNANADAMSRLPLEDGALGIRTPGDVVQFMEHLSTTCVTSDKIKVWTRRDPVTSRVLQYVRDGWPSDVSDEFLEPYAIRKTELSVEGGCKLWDNTDPRST